MLSALCALSSQIYPGNLGRHPWSCVRLIWYTEVLTMVAAHEKSLWALAPGYKAAAPPL
jgi:hypothetical protein